MIVTGIRKGQVSDIAIDPVNVVHQIYNSWVLDCGQDISHSLGECGYWQTPVCNVESGKWHMENIRLATKEEIAQHKALRLTLKTTMDLFD